MRLLPPAATSKLSRKLPARIGMLKSLVSNLIKYEQIVTTPARAEAIRPIVDLVIRNCASGRPDLRQEVEAWTEDHTRTLPLLYGPLRTRYAATITPDAATATTSSTLPQKTFTRTYQLLHRDYKHTPRAVVELVDGPRDTLRLLQQNSDDIKAAAENLKEAVPDDTVDDMTNPVAHLSLNSNDLLKVQSVPSRRRGRMHKHHLDQLEAKQERDNVLKEAGYAKSQYVMEKFAEKAAGLSIPSRHPNFYVN